jgi:hypothetical protein
MICISGFINLDEWIKSIFIDKDRRSLDAYT